MENKVSLAKKSREEYGLNRCLRALGLSKGTWHRLSAARQAGSVVRQRPQKRRG